MTKIIGTSLPIHDAICKVSGTAKYAGDMELPQMLHAFLVTSTVPNGLVMEVDASQALARPGVVAVLDCFNCGSKAYNRYRSFKGQKVLEQEYVFNRRVLFVGDRVACVIAQSAEEARIAAGLVKVIYEQYPAALTVEESLDGKIDGVHPEGVLYEGMNFEVGRPEIKNEDDIKVKTESVIPGINHVALEPHACVAAYDHALGELTIWSPNQSVHGIRTVVAEMFDLPYHKVRVVKTTMGGSFGGKQEWVLEPVAAAAALKLRRPVRLVFSREQVFISTINRAPMKLSVESCFKADGRLLSVNVDHTLQAGAYLGNSQDYCMAMSKKFFRCYKYPHLKYQGRAVITNTFVSGSFRGWSSPESAIALEHNINQAARCLNVDPIEIRLINAAEPGDIDPSINLSLGSFHLRECLLRGRDRFKWAERKARIMDFNQANGRFLRGLGVACGGHLNSYFPKIKDFAEAGLFMTEDGGVIANITLHDHGCGTVTAFKMIIAETLGIEENMVSVSEGDTAVTPYDYGCYSSRTTYVIGRATQNAALSLLQRLLSTAAILSERPLENMFADRGMVKDKNDPDFSMTYGEIAHASIIDLREEMRVSVRYANQSNPGVAGVHLTEVEVDTATGMTRLIDYLAVHDIGQTINREMCKAQVQGAVLMGAGAALYEHLTVDSKGRGTCSLKDYHLINSFEAPNIEVEFIERGETDGPFGAKSIGEVCHVPVAPAVLGAVNDALGTDCGTLPLNPDLVVKMLKENGYQYDVKF